MEDSFRLSLGDIIAQLEEDEAIDRLQKLVDYLAEAYRFLFMFWFLKIMFSKKAENDLVKTAMRRERHGIKKELFTGMEMRTLLSRKCTRLLE